MPDAANRRGVRRGGRSPCFYGECAYAPSQFHILVVEQNREGAGYERKARKYKVTDQIT